MYKRVGIDLAVQFIAAGLIAFVSGGAVAAIFSNVAWVFAGTAVLLLTVLLVLASRHASQRQTRSACLEHLTNLSASLAAEKIDRMSDGELRDFAYDDVLVPLRDNLRSRKVDVGVSILEEQGERFAMPLAVGYLSGDKREVGRSLPKQLSFSWQTVLKGRPLECKDINDDERWTKFPEVPQPEKGSMYSIPLAAKGDRAMVFNVVFTATDALDDWRRTYLIAVASVLTCLGRMQGGGSVVAASADEANSPPA